jgi:type I restriction enzyme S subunit
MEVKPGYKQTEVGVIPEKWDVRSIGETFRLVNGCAFKPEDWKSNGTPIIRIQNLNDPSASFNYSQAPVAERNRVEAGDLLFAWSGTIGTSFGARVWAGPSGILNQHIFKVHMDQQQITLPFSLLVFARIEEDIAKQAHGFKASFVHVKKSDLVKVRLPLPPLPEQRAIATALSDVDGLLGGLDRLIAKKRDLKQAAMQQLLTGQTRLPGFHGEWEVKRLGDVCRITTGKKDVNEGNPDGQFPFFTCSRSHTFSDSYSFDTEAILIAGNGEVGNLHYINGKFEAYQRTYVLCAFSAHVRYLWQQLSAYLADSLGLGKIGSSIPYIKKQNLLGFEFNSPHDPAEQTAIAEVLTEMDTELARLKMRQEKTRALKQAMMQELLTGKTQLI